MSMRTATCSCRTARTSWSSQAGFNVYPQETENELILHPAVTDAAVFGVSRSRPRRGGEGGGSAGGLERGRPRAGGRADRLAADAPVRREVPEVDRLPTGAAAPRHRQAVQETPARPLLDAPRGEGDEHDGDRQRAASGDLSQPGRQSPGRRDRRAAGRRSRRARARHRPVAAQLGARPSRRSAHAGSAPSPTTCAAMARATGRRTTRWTPMPPISARCLAEVGAPAILVGASLGGRHHARSARRRSAS